MAEDVKTPLHKHEHPIYPWIGLFAALFIVLGLAGWYYLTYLDTLNAETDSVMTSAYQTTSVKTPVVNPATGTDGQKTTSSADQTAVDQSITAAEKQINAVSNNDFSDNALGSSAVGVSN